MKLQKGMLELFSNLCFVLGFASIFASIYIWYSLGAGAAGIGTPGALDDTYTLASRAYGERFGIFVGLWAPTFFILSNRLERYAERARN